MKTIFAQFRTHHIFLVLVILLAFSQASCSRKSGCPAEDIQNNTGEDGLPKAGKKTSGLIPPKGYKWKRYKKKKH